MSGSFNGLGGLPTVQSNERIRPVAAPQQAQVGDLGAGALMSLSHSIGQVGAMFGKQAEGLALEQGEREGRNVVIDRDEAGRPVAPAERNTGFGALNPANRAFDAAARQAYLDTAKQDAATDLTRLAIEHRNTPEAFLPAAQARIEGMVRGAPDGFRGELQREFSGQAQGMSRQLIGQWATVQQQQGARAWQMQATSYEDEMRLLAQGGMSPDDPAFVAARDRLAAQYARGVVAGHIGEDQRQLLIEQAGTNALAFGIAGEAGRIAQRDGPEAAVSWANRMLADPRLAAAGQQAISQARAEVSRMVYDARVSRGQAQGDVREEAQAIASNARAGVTITAASTEAVARRATAAGLPHVAAEVRALGQIAGEVTALSGAGLPAISSAYQAAVSGRDTDPLNGMRAQQFGALLTQQVQALQRDPVGWAQSQPAVRAAAEAGDLGGLVRAQDAALAAQGVPVVNARILPRARVTQIEEALTQAPPGQAAAVLQQVFSAYPPEYRHRIWNDLRGANVPADLRPAMILMTSEQSRTALPSFMAAAAMNESQLTSAAGGTEGLRDIREAASRKLEGLRDATGAEDAQYLADVGQAVRMVATVGGRGSAQERVDYAYRLVVDGHTRVERAGGSTIRIPAGVNVDVPKLSQMMRETVTNGIEPTSLIVPPGAIPQRPGLTDETRQMEYFRSFVRSGRWTTLPDGTGIVFRDGENRPVAMRNGQYLMIKYGEEATGEIGSLRAPPPVVAPPAPPAAPPAAPPSPGASVRDLNQQFAARRQQIMDDPSLNARQQEQALARLSAERAAAGGTPERPGGYAANQGVDGAFAGLPAPSGVVRASGTADARVSRADASSAMDTPIPEPRQAAFQSWAAGLAEKRGQPVESVLRDQNDYDLQGAFLAGARPDARGHLPDTFKKPNHPTFSNQSRYNGVGGAEGGRWDRVGGKDRFTAGRTNIEVHGVEGLRAYFAERERGNILRIPANLQ